jgi:hypothetical protein
MKANRLDFDEPQQGAPAGEEDRRIQVLAEWADIAHAVVTEFDRVGGVITSRLLFSDDDKFMPAAAEGNR